MSLADLCELPPVIPAYVADEVLGIGSSLGKALRRQGRYPVPFFSVGRLHKVSTIELLRYLGFATPSPPDTATEVEPNERGAR